MWWWLTVMLAWAGPVVVVVDGTGAGDALSQNINRELELLGSKLTIAPADVREGEPTLDRVLADLQRAAARRDIDMVLAYGPLASLAARQLSRPRVPVIAAMDLLGDPPPAGVIALPMSVDLDAAVDTMRRIVGGEVVLIAPESALALGILPEDTLPAIAPLSLPEGVLGVVVLPLTHLTDEERVTLFGAWADQGIPTLALGGDLRSGATAVLTQGDGPSSIARRAALIMTTIEQGRTPSLRSVRLEFDTLRISALAMEALGLSPPFDIMAEAEVVGWRDAWPVLQLDEAVASAFLDSPSLEATRQSLAADNTEVQQANANFLPQAEVGLSVAQLNDNVTFGFQGNQQFTGELSASQLFYDNQAMMNLFLQRDLRTARSYEFAVAEQDLSYNLTSVYIGLMRALGLLDIRRADLDRVQSGLKVARDRLRAGDVAASEVARWEAEVASARAALVSAWMDTLAAMISVNQLRGAPAGFRFQPRIENAPPLLDWLASPEQLDRLAEAVSEVAQERTPSLDQYDALVAAQDRLLRAARRAYYMPTVAGSVTLNGNLAISEPTSPLATPMETPNFNVTAGANLTVPVFNGGALRASQKQAEMDLVALERTREAIRQSVAAQSIEAVNRAYASTVQANLRRTQVEAVNRTLASVLDAYARGAANQTTVTEARTSALQAELSALDATYEALQRSYDVLYAAGAMPTPSAPDAPSQLRDAVRAIFLVEEPDTMEAEP